MELTTLIKAELQAMGVDPNQCDPEIIHQMSALRAAQLSLIRSVVRGAPDNRKPLTVKEAADRLGVSKQWVYDHIRAGDLRTLQTSGRILIPARVVDDIVAGLSSI